MAGLCLGSIRRARQRGNNSPTPPPPRKGAPGKASFLISAPAFSRLGPAAGDRGWRSDPEYAQRTVERLIARVPAGGAREIGGRRLEDLAAMSGEFTADTIEEVIAAIARFFRERPSCVEAEGVDHGPGGMAPAFEPLDACAVVRRGWRAIRSAAKIALVSWRSRACFPLQPPAPSGSAT